VGSKIAVSPSPTDAPQNGQKANVDATGLPHSGQGRASDMAKHTAGTFLFHCDHCSGSGHDRRNGEIEGAVNDPRM
jgi:hypothetical protein